MPRASRRRVLPWAALGLLFLCDALAAPSKQADVKDTHERLERIYKKLGIQREEEAPPPKPEGGCGCGQQQQKPEAKPERRPAQLPRAPAMPPFLGYLLVILVLAATLVPVYFALRSSYRSGSAAASAPEPEEPRPNGTPTRGPWLVDLEECRRLVAAGRVTEAFAALHRATLLALARQSLLTLEDSSTNWEYVRRLTSKPALRQMLAAVTLAAEQSVLGKRPPERDHYFALERQVLEVTGGHP